MGDHQGHDRPRLDGRYGRLPRARQGGDGPSAQPQRRPGDVWPVPEKITDAVLDALSDHEKHSMPLLEDEAMGRQFTLLLFNLLGERGIHDAYSGGRFTDL